MGGDETETKEQPPKQQSEQSEDNIEMEVKSNGHDGHKVLNLGL